MEILTLDRLSKLQGDEVRKYGEKETAVRTLMNFSDNDFGSEFTACKRPKFPPFPRKRN